MTPPRALTGIALLLAAVLSASAQPAGQAAQGQATGTMQGVSLERDQPVRIEAATLEVRDKVRQATFSGDVKLTQGDTTLRCKVLVVFYEDTAAPKKGAAQAQTQKGGTTAQQIKRAEAKGDVFVTQKDQTASGDNGVFDLKSNTVTMTGNVVVTQGQTVMRGERMVVNLTTGVTKVDSSSGKGGGRVELLAQPGAKDAKAAPAPAPAPPPAKQAPRAPIRIN
jgi:lipopolysaccharide export system protein LptA